MQLFWTTLNLPRIIVKQKSHAFGTCKSSCCLLTCWKSICADRSLDITICPVLGRTIFSSTLTSCDRLLFGNCIRLRNYNGLHEQEKVPFREWQQKRMEKQQFRMTPKQRKYHTLPKPGLILVRSLLVSNPVPNLSSDQLKKILVVLDQARKSQNQYLNDLVQIIGPSNCS